MTVWLTEDGCSECVDTIKKETADYVIVFGNDFNNVRGSLLIPGTWVVYENKEGSLIGKGSVINIDTLTKDAIAAMRKDVDKKKPVGSSIRARPGGGAPR